MRPIYNKFLRITRDILGDDEIPTEELHSAARLIYNICNDIEGSGDARPPAKDEDDSEEASTKRDKSRRAAIKSNFPTFQDKFWNDISHVAQHLYAWRQEHHKIKQERDRKRESAAQATSIGAVPVAAISEKDILNPRVFSLLDFLTKVPEVYSRTDAVIPSYDDVSAVWKPIGDFPLPGDEPYTQIDETFDEPSSASLSQPTSAGGIIDWREADSEPFDAEWLRNQCTKFIEVTNSPYVPIEMAATLTSYLISAKSDAELQEQLLNFLGYDSFEFIELLFRNRLKLVTLSSQRPSAANGGNTASIVGNSFTVMTKQDKILQKLQEKELRKIRQTQGQSGRAGALADPAALAQKRVQQLSQGPNTNLRPAQEMPMDAGWLKKTLPAGTIRKEFAGYDDVFVPPPAKDALPEATLVDIESNFADFAKLVFRGVKRLNRIQSTVFEAAYKSNENLLICAPTGAGKTNVALMTMLHEVGLHFTSDGVLRKDDFKMVYIAPMKALAAEMVENFGKRFQPLNLVVKELTGDMQLTKKEIQETQLIVTTPEKWDVMTRKSTDNALTAQVKLIIIDEVHLLHEDRGAVIESLVARTLRQVEQTQAMIRIVGLSATLPNYRDVAQFLRVNPQTGLFFFGDAYRPVPLSQNFVGIKSKDPQKAKTVMLDICLDKIKKSVQQGNQVMVFVHSRKDTVNTALQLLDLVTNQGKAEMFTLKEKDTRCEPYFSFQKDVQKSRNHELRELFPRGFGIHHAGMLRADRTLTEKMFSQGMLKVLVCTATLAWGVNLPAHTVIIKGTQVYSAEKGQFVDLGMLDVMQIFGRAGRPQFDTSGEAIMLTSHDRLPHYLGLLTHQTPIESTFVNRLADHLNAEIVLGTVNNVQDAVQWLSYTYLHVRMLKNPLAYGITYQQKEMDPHLLRHKSELIKVAAKILDRCKMIRYDERLGNLYPTDLGRVASHYYIQYETVELFSSNLRPNYSDAEIFNIVAQSSEFENIMVREEEMEELDRLENEECLLDVRGEGVQAREGKVNVLLQSFVSQASINTFSLVSDMAYVAQNAARIFRALFEMALKKNWPRLATKLLGLCKMVDRRMWGNAHPLRQFASNQLTAQILGKLEEKRMSVDRICEMSADELGALVKGNKLVGRKILTIARMFPQLDVEATVQPITRSVLRIHLTLTANFNWNDKVHGSIEPFWIWVEDSQTEFIYHSEYFLLHKKQKDEPQKMTFIVPIQPQDPATGPGQYYIHILSDRWMGSETIETLSFKNLVLPNELPPHTELLPLQPLPVSALGNELFQSIYPFTHFNPIQTQTFHTLYHTDSNVLVGAPTGSGKTIVSEIAMMKIFRDTPKLKVVYIAPLKALVRERQKDWQKKLVQKMGKKLVELTGDYTPDMQMLQTADIILTTPEKWDGISRNWQSRSYVKQVGLIIIDEIHLLGEERGPILEVIVSRMRYVSSAVGVPIRLIGLSTAMANALDLADWLGIDPVVGLYNFRPSVRPVPLEVHIAGFRGKHYCPRMQTMNKPAFQTIKTHSPMQSTLIFVSSRRQTRLTATDLITFAASEGDPTQFLHMTPEELEGVLVEVRDSSLRHTLQFGVGLHHAGLPETDKAIVEELFGENKIQILISTATLAWGVNLPAHLVVVKGTEFFDPKSKRYVDYPITDVLQMMGRAGRPQFDTQGVAMIMVEESKKPFYKKFLYDPFPVESNLKEALHDHMSAEVVSGTIASKQDAIDYLTWTYFFRRLLKNPTYYQLEDVSNESLNTFLSRLVDETLSDLERAECIRIGDDISADAEGGIAAGAVEPTTLGRIASYYYLHYGTVQIFSQRITEDANVDQLLRVLADTHEYRDLPVRHNEDKLNVDLCDRVRFPPSKLEAESPNAKAFILLQTHFSAMSLPISDYYTDTKSVLDQAVRIIQAMVDVSAERGYLQTALRTVGLMQMVLQGVWYDESPLLTLPHFRERVFMGFADSGSEFDGAYDKPPSAFSNNIIAVLANDFKVETLPQLAAMDRGKLNSVLQRSKFTKRESNEVFDAIDLLPIIDVNWKVHPATIYVSEGGEDNCQLKLSLQRKSREPKGGVYAPRFPKYKDEGWWVILGDEKSGELVALRRINFKNRSNVNLSFPRPSEAGKHALTLFFMSDSYIGMDQQYRFTFETKAKPAAAQVVMPPAGLVAKKENTSTSSNQPAPAVEEAGFWDMEGDADDF